MRLTQYIVEMESYDFRTLKEKKLENELICSLRSQDELYKLANHILFKYIQLAKKAGYQLKEIINIIRIYYFNPSKLYQKFTSKKSYSRIPPPKFTLKRDVIVKNGYNCIDLDCYKVVNCNTEEELYNLNKLYSISLLQITSAFYRFQIENKLITYCIDNSIPLQKKILDFMIQYMGVPKTYSYIDIKELVKKSYGHWFFPWVCFFGISDSKNLTHHHLNEEEDYIRKWKMTLTQASNVKTKSNNLLFCSIHE